MNIDDIMDEIKADIEARGLVDDAPVFDSIKYALPKAGSEHTEHLAIEQALSHADATCLVGPNHAIQGNALSRLVKRMIRKLIGFHIAPIVEDQNRHNIFSNRAMHVMANTVESNRAVAERQITALKEEMTRLRNDMEHANEALRREILTAIETEEFRLFRESNNPQPRGGSLTKSDRHSAADQSSVVGGMDFDYFDFENHFRGARFLIKDRQRIYLPYLKTKKEVLEIGCGRGEFLELLRENDILSRGVDIYPEFVEWCVSRRLPVELGDGLKILSNCEDDSLGGVVGLQIAEHLSFEELGRLCHTAYKKLSLGGALILETPNPSSLAVFRNAFYIDPTHTKPIHNLLLSYIVEKSGFSEVHTVFIEESKDDGNFPAIVSDSIVNLEQFNKALTQLNLELYGSQDYAIIAVK